LRRLEFHADHPQLFPSLRSGPNHPTAAPSRRNLAVPLGVPRHPVLSVFAAVGARKGGCFAGYALCGFWHPGLKPGYAWEGGFFGPRGLSPTPFRAMWVRQRPP